MLHFLRNLKFFWFQFQNSLWHTITSLQQKWCNNNLLGVVPVLQGLQRSLQSCPNKDVKVQAPLRIIEFSVLVVIQKLQSLVEKFFSLWWWYKSFSLWWRILLHSYTFCDPCSCVISQAPSPQETDTDIGSSFFFIHATHHDPAAGFFSQAPRSPQELTDRITRWLLLISPRKEQLRIEVWRCGYSCHSQWIFATTSPWMEKWILVRGMSNSGPTPYSGTSFACRTMLTMDPLLGGW